LNYLYGGAISKLASFIYFHVHVANVCDHLYAISETPCELRGSRTNVIGCRADVVKLGYQWRKRVVIYVSEIIRVSLLVFNLFFVSMSSVYIFLAICIVVGVNSDEHTHIVSSIIHYIYPSKGVTKVILCVCHAVCFVI